MKRDHFEVYPRLTLFFGRQWFWRLRAANGRIIASGEGYRDKADALRAVELVRVTDAATPIEMLP